MQVNQDRKSAELTSKSDKRNKSKGKAKKVRVFTKRSGKTEPENVFIQKLQDRYSQIDTKSVKSFTDLPLSPRTLKGLKEWGYTKPTEIQRETIALSLQGKDILGAAQTGSGKTLAFLLPLLELLYCKRWTNLDGLGALVITPTRELAYQIFETLRKVGAHHDFSAGLIIGGKDLKFERNRMDQCNIVICTPGRLLQHMDENPLFNCDNMQILVLDEADRCLDMGFEKTMNAIIANLPPKRQTLLFSATQTKSVRDLARLSLKDSCYVSVHEHSEYSTPSGLTQNYVVCELKDKVSVVWSFIKNHLKHKCIIFFASCKQVKYIYEIFCKLRPGTTLLALYGTLHQLRRMKIYEEFCQKQHAVLFATDLAARGLDFPEVHWVVQADCPEDSATYIHRVGRTARFHRGGESLLLLLPSEMAMLDDLKERKVPIGNIEINPIKLFNPVRKMEAFLAAAPSLKDSAQRAFKAYAKSVFLMKNKQVFKIQELDIDSYSKSLGLAVSPRIRFLQKMNRTNQHKSISISKSQETSRNFNSITTFDDNSESVSFVSRENQKFQVSDDSDDDVLKVKRTDHDIDLPADSVASELPTNTSKTKKKLLTKAALVKKMLHKKIVPNTRITFNEEGEAMVATAKEKRSAMALEYENEDVGGIDIDKARLVLREEDKFDKQLFQQKVKAKHKETKRKLKEKNREDERDDFGTDSDVEPDLSWLPDPDKIYGKSEDGDNETKSCSDNNQNSQDVITDNNKDRKKWKKRKLDDTNTQEHSHKKKKKLDKLNDSLSVNEAEELAMMLLRK